MDYAFLDEDDEFDYNSVDGFFGADGFMRKKRSAECETCLKTGVHVVYKRRDVSDNIHGGDYSELLSFMREGISRGPYRVSVTLPICRCKTSQVEQYLFLV